MFDVAALVGLLVFGFYVLQLLLWSIQNEIFWVDLVKQHVPGMIGVPLAAFAALGLVLILETTSGPIDFDVGGLVKAKGAAGPLLMWVLCFSAMAAAIKYTWNP